ncbi:MAG: F0F1 ATP synthase subunit A [Bacteroidota bacterium]
MNCKSYTTTSSVFKRVSLFVAAVCFATLGFANDTEPAHHGVEEEVKQLEKEEKFNPTEMIMHHIADSHEFHVYGDAHDGMTIALPVILWTNNGLVTFMSSEFHHNDDATHIVEKNGQKFVKFHDKIFYANETANEHGQYVQLDEQHHVSSAKPLDFSITKNVFSLLLSFVVIVLLFLSVAAKYRTRGNVAPRGTQSFLEPLILFVRDDIAVPNIGAAKAGKYLPYLLTIFFFIWINNLIGLIPFFPFGSNLTGNIAFTLVMAFITLIVVNISANKDYWKHIFWMPGVPVPVKILLAPIELMGVLTKPVALMIRLFANITAGHIIILSLIALIFIFQSLAIGPVSVAFVLFMNVLELLVAALQAYIFTMLTALFIGSAIADHHHDEHSHGAEAHH